jgi:c(7)-type cytochrome triheme protein
MDKKVGSPAVLVVLTAFIVLAASSARLDAQSTTPQLNQAAPLTQSPDQPKKKKRPSAANSFNRLLKRPAAASNAPPSEDGIHDPANPGTALLQWPSEAFQDLPKTSDGNLVDWVKALDEGLIAPWTDLYDPDAEPFIMDLVIVREVKGSMPDVVYSHRQHTEWLDCTNCHDDIFIPEKGANQMSMAGILLGQKCGACHGKVAFPVSDCRRCHSRPKTKEQLRALAERSAWHGKQSGQAN